MSVREGYKQTEIGVIPVEWNCQSMEDIFIITAGKSKSKFVVENGKYTLIDMGAIDRNGQIVNKKFLDIEDDFLAAKDLVMPKDDIGGGQIIGKVVYIPQNNKYILGDHVFKLTLKDDFCARYFYYLINSSYVNRTFRKKATGTAQIGLGKKSVAEQPLAVPPLPEQQKIAAILTSVDNKIEVIDEQIAKTETLKKGLMQELLSEGIGHTAFKESKIGRIPKEWEVVRLGDCIVNKGQYGINAPATDFNENLPTYLRITDIDENGNFITSNRKCVAHQDSDDFILKDGDIVFARTGNTTGKSYLYNPKDGKLVFAGFLIKFTLQQDKLYPYYLKLITQTQRYWNWVKVTSTRTGQPGINSEEYSRLVLPLPPIQEQKQIAIILSTTDNKLDTLREKKSRYEKLKKGLMQKLLTGKVRVKPYNEDAKEIK